MSAPRIVAVEDDEGIREILAMTLEVLGGCEVQTFADGNAAIRAADGLRPDLLLLDVVMPGLTGPQTLAELRKRPHLAAVPALFLTASTRANTVAELRALGAVDVIAKPFDPADLWNRVSAVLQSRT